MTLNKALYSIWLGKIRLDRECVVHTYISNVSNLAEEGITTNQTYVFEFLNGGILPLRRCR